MKRISTIITAFILALASYAQEFVTLSSEDYPVGTWFEGLVEGVTEVSLQYPELEKLTSRERKELKSQGLTVGENPVPEFHVAYSRKKPVLEIRLLPFVQRERTYYRIKSILVTPKKKSENRIKLKDASKASRYAEHSVLSQGTWVKIHVSEEGIYQMTTSQLSRMGFTDINKIKVYGYGGRSIPESFSFSGYDALTDDLEEIPLYRTNSKVMFFAEGVIRWTYQNGSKKWTHRQNPYSKYSYYFVTQGDNPLTLNTLAAGATTTSIDTVRSYNTIDNDAYSVYPGGREFLDSYDFSSGQSKTYTLHAPGAVENSPAIVDIAFSASSNMSSTALTTTLNGSTLGTLSVPMYGENESGRLVVGSFNTTNITSSNNIKLQTSNNNTSRLDYIRVNYTRRLDATDNGYSFSPNIFGAVNITIANATSNTEVWRIGRKGINAARVSTALSGSTLTANLPDGLERYVIVNLNEEYPSPDSDGTIANQDLHGDATPYDMVIITPSSGILDEQAKRIADLHSTSDGMKVKVVQAGTLYNEFSGGTPDASAYRLYMKMLYDRASTDDDMPKYLLLFGDCLWDNRGVTSTGKNYNLNNFLLSYENNIGTSTSISLGSLNTYPCDDYFGLLDDGEGSNILREKTDLGIGRIPCHDAATAKILVDKIIAYSNNEHTGSWKDMVVFLADNGDNNMHLKDTESTVETFTDATNDKFVVRKIYQDAYRRVTSATGNTFPEATSALKALMQNGALMFNYTGHGSPHQLSHANLLKEEDFSENASPNLPIWVFASCEITPIDQQEEDIGRRALFNPNGGAISVMCSSRAVYASYNRALNKAFCKYVFNFDKDGRQYTMGDAIRLCKNDLVSSSDDVTSNKLKYALLGDPALKVAIPKYDIILDSINGVALQRSSFIQLKAGQLVRFSGHIENLPNFNGVLTATIYDHEETITCKNNDGSADTPMKYTTRQTIIYEGNDSVSNGKFSLTTVIPRGISYTEDAAQIALYAVSNDRLTEAHGKNEQFYLYGTDTSTAKDTLGPKIQPYLNDPEFIYGGMVGQDILFGATITDETGIDVTGNILGHDMELVIDGKTSDTYILNKYFTYDFSSYNSGTVTYQLTGIEPGHHTLTFRAWDVCDNSSTAVLSFVVTENLNSEFDIYATNNPSRTNTNFVVSNIDTSTGNTEVEIEVYDVFGRRVWAKTVNTEGSPYCTTTWNLSTTTGMPLPAGIYIYRAKTHGNETDGKKIIIIK